jgi:hypothetical protein
MNLTPATATIDAGRLLTLERRREFAGLSLQIVDDGSIAKNDRIIDCQSRPESAGVLSERRIARSLLAFPGWYSLEGESPDRVVGILTGKIAQWVHESMRDWANGGYVKAEDGLVNRKRFAGYMINVNLHHHL